MKTLLRIAFRNLFRQKRRNFFLGAAISIGTLVLVLANSFSHGISRTLINEVVSYVAGHANVGFAHRGQLMSQILRGGAHWKEEIAKIPGAKKVDPTMGVMARVIGNGKSDNSFLVAINMHSEFSKEDSLKNASNFPMISGDWNDLKDTTIENPLILSEDKAKFLHVKKGDIVRARLQDFNGRFQAARFTVCGIFQPSNMFMNGAMFLELRDMSRLMGLRPEDSPYLYLTMENPERDAIRIADSVWRLMAPPLAYIQDSAGDVISGYHADSTSLASLKKMLGTVQGDTALAYSRKAALFSQVIADSLQLKIGDTATFQYPVRFVDSTGALQANMRLVVGGIFTPPVTLPARLVLVNEVPFYEQFYDYLPKAQKNPLLCLDSANVWFKALTTEWIRLPRAHSTEDLGKRRRDISQGKYKGTTLTIDTMYESASSVLKLESALQIITFSAVMVIFFIILIGVVNTLRMTIRERTREIGTLRAIGMQQSEIRTIFVLETALLAFFASVTGTVLAFLAMLGLSALTIPTAGNPLGIILVNSHLVFAPTVFSVIFFNILIVLIAVATAWFPASRAAKLPAATAMRQYD